jgi:hypothetical protein
VAAISLHSLGRRLHVDIDAIRRRVGEFDEMSVASGPSEYLSIAGEKISYRSGAGEVSAMISELEVGALLDTHDALVRECLDDRLGFGEFLAAYGEFPAGYGLDEQTASTDQRAVLNLFHKRIAFHVLVAGALSGLRSTSGSTVYGDVERFLPTVGRMRLRGVVAKYPKFEADAGTTEGTI